MATPMQRIETIDEPRSRAESQGDLFDSQKAHLDDFRNRLVWGDNKLVTASLRGEFKGQVDLIYIDPPFDVGADFTMKLALGDDTDTVTKDQSALETVAYRDTWGKGADSYIHMMSERLLLMRDLLSEGGAIYVHSDWRINSLLRLVLDETFGAATSSTRSSGRTSPSSAPRPRSSRRSTTRSCRTPSRASTSSGTSNTSRTSRST
jgi:hypothetical protein